MATYEPRVRSIFLSALLAVATVLVFLIFRLYVASFLLAFVLTIIFRPVFLRILKRVGNRETLAAILTTILVVIIILIPVGIFATLIINEVADVLASPANIIAHLSNLQHLSIVQRYHIDLKTYAENALNGFVHGIGGLFHNVVQFFIDAILTLISLIYLFKDGGNFSRVILNALPFTKVQAEKLSEDITIGIRAVIGGYLLVAIIQGLVSGIGFWIFGVSNPALWGFVTVIAALVPTFGTSLVNVPAILSLLFNHHIGAGIGLTIWWLTAISIIDNFIGPRFISGRVRIHVLLLIFSIIGGLKMFGALGFLIGPLIVIFFWSILEMFQDRDSDRESAAET